MTDPKDFRPFVPTLDYPRVAAFQGRDAYQHGDAGLANPYPKALLFDPWDELYAQEFLGVTTNGQVVPGLFQRQAQDAPVQAMVEAALAMLNLLSAEQRRLVSLTLHAREWRRWNNTEMYIYRYGLRLEELGLAARESILKLMACSLSPKGFEKTRNTMRINHFLGTLTHNTKVLGEWSYNFTLFGEPSLVEPWGWQVSGHHLALNCLVIKDQMVISPTFMGAEPNSIDEGLHAGLKMFEDEERQGLSLINALSASQREKAIVYHSSVGGDLPDGRRHKADQLHLGGAMQDNRIIAYEGIAAKHFNAAQQTRLLDLVQSFIEPLPAGPHKARMQEVQDRLDETYFSWIGGTQDHDTFYYRIQSPVIMAEFDHHSGVFLTNNLPAKFHIHTLVRTPNGGDYGKDLLRLHYLRDHDASLNHGVVCFRMDHERRDPSELKRSNHPAQTLDHDHGPGHSHDHAHGPGHSHDHSHDHPPSVTGHPAVRADPSARTDGIDPGR